MFRSVSNVCFFDSSRRRAERRLSARLIHANLTDDVPESQIRIPISVRMVSRKKKEKEREREKLDSYVLRTRFVRARVRSRE